MDFGCGSMNDIGTITKAGFVRIDAVDSEDSVSAIARSKVKAGVPVTFTKSSFAGFPFEDGVYDFFSSQNSLPFIRPEDFNVVMRKIKNSIASKGVFVGTFFGPDDEWAEDACVTIVTRNDIEDTFKDWEIIKMDEEKAVHPTAAGDMKHWHIFTVIARKP